ncbi:MAG: hypothetical protein GXP15_13215 [Gammaproteobacteria bacterium]|nr:hypothetical protein [Gammaproteobacteria bacterium]
MSFAIGRRTIVAAAALGIACSAFAHRAPGSLTTIKWNATSGRTEIVHRLHSHDAELGVGDVLKRVDLSAIDLAGRAYIALYVEERFRMADANGELELSLVGAILEGDHILVYQEYAGRLPHTVRIRDDILRDAYPAQVNQVNIEDGDATHSLVFANDDEWHRYESRQ